MKMNKIWTVEDNFNPINICTRIMGRLFVWPVMLFLIPFICLSLSGCGDSSKPNIPKSLTPHAAIKLDGGTAVESNLAITSNNTTESAVSVTNGGNLTLNDSTIVKTAPAGSIIGGPPNPNQAPGALASASEVDLPGTPTISSAGSSQNINIAQNPDRAPDPSLAPSTPGPPGTPGGMPPSNEQPGGGRGPGAGDDRGAPPSGETGWAPGVDPLIIVQ